ncbi:AAA-like domain-containing protein [Uruburuella testudinis]|uniref:AAA-like domain-containing protein n=1 Tax=Uruburuella testudinis TaxID=1282863 RepID=A0ABY4DU34_9NEIS|nr:AAA-like domain-containing protein [Uruburuella testudinis]UOO82547.1 AAA-like domain-containing protein [Uruburuella testudinis]
MQADPLYFHRPEYAAKLINSLQGGITHAFTLFAPRRMGKTQFLLKDIAPLAEQQGFNVFYFSFMADDGNIPIRFQTALQQFAENIQTGGKAKTFIGQISKVEAFGLVIERQHSADPAGGIVELISTIAAANRPALLLLDEVQELARFTGAAGLIRSLRTGLDIHQDHVKTIFTGSSTNGLKTMFNNSKAPFFHFAHALDFPQLGQDFTDFLADIYCQRTGNSLDKAALYRLFERLNHTPMYMRAIIQDMIINPELPLEAAADYRLAQLNTQGTESGVWQKLKPLEQAIMQAMAATDSSSPYSNDSRKQYAAALGINEVSSSSTQGAIKRLQRHDLISKNTADQWQINNPLLKTWILENT